MTSVSARSPPFKPPAAGFAELVAARLLEVLGRHPNRALSLDLLRNEASGYDAETTTRTVDVHVGWLFARSSARRTCRATS